MSSMGMDSAGGMIVALLLAVYFLETLSGLLNLFSLKPKVPVSFEGVYDQPGYEKLVSYTKETSHFHIVESTISLILLLVFWFWGGFDRVDHVARRLPWNEIGRGLVFFSILSAGKWLTSLPFDLHRTFGIEERFGFNRTTWKTFVLDEIKNLVVGGILGAFMLTLLILVFQHASAMNLIVGWLVLCALIWLLSYIAPSILLPLFNKLTPLPEGILRTAILDYANGAGFPLSELFVMDGSRRSARANAFFTGFGKQKRIVLYDTLIAQHPVEELVAVLAHEIAHFKKRHIWKHLGLSMLNLGVFFYLASECVHRPALLHAFKISQPSTYAGLMTFLIIFQALSVFVALFTNAVSRKHEFEADRFAAQTTSAGAMAGALKRLARENLSNPSPHPLHVWLFHSHPPILQRLEALKSA